MNLNRCRSLTLLLALLLAVLPVVATAAPAHEDASTAGRSVGSWVAAGIDGMLAFLGLDRAFAAGGFGGGDQQDDGDIGSMLDPDGNNLTGGGPQDDGDIGSMLDPDG
jgi:hypothetical protein